MMPSKPPPPTSGSPDSADRSAAFSDAGGPRAQAGADDPLETLGEHVRAAHDAAERLVREATERAYGASGERPPSQGYAAPGGPGAAGETADAQALVALLRLGRGLLPPELRVQLTALIREVLLLVRALIDWYLGRLEGRREATVEIEDIPIF